MVANADNHSELSGFDSDMMTTEEMIEILESRNRSLIEHTLLLNSDKLTKWTKEMNRQMFNKSQSTLNPTASGLLTLQNQGQSQLSVSAANALIE